MNAKELTIAFAEMQAEISALKAEIQELKAQKPATRTPPKPQASGEMVGRPWRNREGKTVARYRVSHNTVAIREVH